MEYVIRRARTRDVRAIDGLVDDASLLTDGGGEQNSGLGGGACAELDQGEFAGRSLSSCRLLKNFVGVRGKDATLGAGQVVLGKLGDLLEEMGASLIVEEPRR